MHPHLETGRLLMSTIQTRNTTSSIGTNVTKSLLVDHNTNIKQDLLFVLGTFRMVDAQEKPRTCITYSQLFETSAFELIKTKQY